MTKIEVNQSGFIVRAEILAEAFKIAPEDVQPFMRDGLITSLSETGIDDDVGRNRLTFRYRDRALRLVVDPTGNILKQIRFPTRKREDLPHI